MEGKHYVLVHGVSHGAWCWYKLKPQLESSGKKVTVLDLAASGINPKRMEDVASFTEYSEPLLEFLESSPPNEKVVLVGHSFGGLSIALAMDKFPHKIALSVFLAAFVPATQHPPSYVMEKDLELAKTLARPGSLFLEELSKAESFSKEGYGSVPTAYIVCSEDLAIPVDFQKWMIQNACVDEVVEIKGADHMAMLSQPHHLFLALLNIANKYN